MPIIHQFHSLPPILGSGLGPSLPQGRGEMTLLVVKVQPKGVGAMSEAASGTIILPGGSGIGRSRPQGTATMTVLLVSVQPKGVGLQASVKSGGIVNKAPTADLVDSSTSGTTVTWDASGSTDPEGDTLSYKFDWTDDGTFDTLYSGDPTQSHDYGATGTFTCRVRVEDSAGNTDEATHSVTIESTA